MKNLLEDLYIPPPPNLFLDIRQAVPELPKVARVVESDPGVASKLLQGVNSPAFGLKVNIASIPHAASLLGLDYVLNIVNGVLLRQMSESVNTSDLEFFWDLSAEVAFYATSISRHLGYGKPDEMYTLGLFHNCGIPVILQKHEEYFEILEDAYTSKGGFITETEEFTLDCHHAEVSYLVSQSWYLPEHIVNAIRYHHDLNYIRSTLEQAETTDDELIKKTADALLVLKMSEHFSEMHLHLGKQEDDHEWAAVKDAIFQYTHLDEDTFKDLHNDIEKEKG